MLTEWGEEPGRDFGRALEFLTGAGIAFEMPEPHEVMIRQDGMLVILTFNGDDSYRRLDVLPDHDS
jgi:hypothetical protein